MPGAQPVIVDLPHTWNGTDGQDGGDDYLRRECCYKKRLSIAKKEKTAYFLDFLGANSVCRVFVNGRLCGGHRGGYTRFFVDITDAVQDGEKTWPNAIECQLCAGDAGDFVLLGGSDIAEFRLQPGETRPAFPVVKKKQESSEKSAGEWNEMDITCRDGNIEVVVNGVLQNQGSQSLHKKGYIGLQSEGGPLEFRNVRLKRLK